MKADSWERAMAAYAIEADAVARAAAAVDRDAFARAVDALAVAPRIAASGCGHSGIACRHFAHLMCCIERPARFVSPAEAVHGATGFLQAGDVLLLASRGGQTAELLPILEIGARKRATTIAVTEDVTSPLAQGADIVLRMAVTREVDPDNTQGTTSFTVLSVLFDALQCAVLTETGFRKEQFAVIHPGGAVGAKLRPPHPQEGILKGENP